MLRTNDLDMTKGAHTECRKTEVRVNFTVAESLVVVVVAVVVVAVKV
jgi:hypothetical protein